jgi:hypothetical protein
MLYASLSGTSMCSIKERPSLVAARNQAVVELRREKFQKGKAEKPHKVARVRSR